MIKKAGACLLFLDYDGTLVGIKPRPQDARPSKRTKSLVRSLNKNPRIYPVLVSGRPILHLMDFFKGTPVKELCMVGSHGAEIKLKDRKPQIIEAAKKQMGQIAEIKDRIKDMLKQKECFYIEDKTVSVALHYRNCDKKELPLLERVSKFISEATRSGGLDVIEGKKVIEVKASKIDKGMAIQVMEKKLFPDGGQINICIGDDVTDEHMFLKNPRGINIKVSQSSSNAQYYLNTISEVQRFLSIINREVR